MSFLSALVSSIEELFIVDCALVLRDPTKKVPGVGWFLYSCGQARAVRYKAQETQKAINMGVCWI